MKIYYTHSYVKRSHQKCLIDITKRGMSVKMGFVNETRLHEYDT